MGRLVVFKQSVSRFGRERGVDFAKNTFGKTLNACAGGEEKEDRAAAPALPGVKRVPRRAQKIFRGSRRPVGGGSVPGFPGVRCGGAAGAGRAGESPDRQGFSAVFARFSKPGPRPGAAKLRGLKSVYRTPALFVQKCVVAAAAKIGAVFTTITAATLLPLLSAIAAVVTVIVILTAWWPAFLGGDAPGAGASAEQAVQIGDADPESIVGQAARHIGKPYVWGAAGPDVFDCSGLTQYVYGKNGISLARTAHAQYLQVKAAGHLKTAVADLAVGDLVFFGSPHVTHVGINIGRGYMIHAPLPGQSVKTGPIYAGFIGGGRP